MKKLTTKDFIEKSKKLHNNYDYTKTIYLNSRTKVKIICPVHGEFEQDPSTHLLGKGCFKCGLKVMTLTEVIKKADNIHNFKYDYTNLIYKNLKSKVKIVCPVHGEFEQLLSSHLSGNGCSKCSFEKLSSANVNDLNTFKKKAFKIHGNKYDYSLVDIFNDKTKIKIVCPVHGVFEQTPHAHKRGNGCRQCAIKRVAQSTIENSRGWSLTDWNKKAASLINATPRLYVLRCFNTTEEFIKVGITMRTILHRFKNKTLMPYSIEILADVVLSSNESFNKELLIKKEFKANRYKPNIKFSGMTECFNISIKNQILKMI